MRNDTIKAKIGYTVCKGTDRRTGEKMNGVFDGSEFLFAGKRISMKDFQDEMRENEMFHICEIFTTVKGNRFIYARDEEIDQDYIIKVEEAEG